jgi:hypothetical protein
MTAASSATAGAGRRLMRDLDSCPGLPARECYTSYQHPAPRRFTVPAPHGRRRPHGENCHPQAGHINISACQRILPGKLPQESTQAKPYPRRTRSKGRHIPHLMRVSCTPSATGAPKYSGHPRFPRPAGRRGAP